MLCYNILKFLGMMAATLITLMFVFANAHRNDDKGELGK
jgi:hypothetical protein